MTQNKYKPKNYDEMVGFLIGHHGFNEKLARGIASDIKGYGGFGKNESEQEIIERVAIAICPWDNGKRCKGNAQYYWQGMSEPFKKAYREQAKAAIKAFSSKGRLTDEQ